MSQESGIIFDIQRSSMHDGPGIRTTVFLKGCPLSCEWCHNPESQSFAIQLGFFNEKCNLCRICSEKCESSVHHFKESSHIVKYERCTGCGECISACPNGALKLYGEKITVQEVMDIVLSDEIYYNKTGGGITLSGGEPLVQLEFSKELLKISKRMGIHTCIDTCGYVPTESLIQILPFTDYFLYDYKLTDNNDHFKYTGVDQKLILNNLDAVYNAGKKILLRCPIIPGVNDNDMHYDAIEKLIKKYPRLEGVEFLPYHNAGLTKAKAIGQHKKLKI